MAAVQRNERQTVLIGELRFAQRGPDDEARVRIGAQILPQTCDRVMALAGARRVGQHQDASPLLSMGSDDVPYVGARPLQRELWGGTGQDWGVDTLRVRATGGVD